MVKLRMPLTDGTAYMSRQRNGNPNGLPPSKAHDTPPAAHYQSQRNIIKVQS